MSAYSFLILTECVIGSLCNAFWFIPLLSHYAKLTPRRLEGSVFALLTGMTSFSLNILAPMIGNFVNKNFLSSEVTSQNLKEQLWHLSLIAVIASILSFPFRWHLLPKSDEFREENK